MPRGFLVKRRSRRPAGVFRLRPPGGPSTAGLEEAPRAPSEPPATPPAEPFPEEPPPAPAAPPAPPPAPSKKPKAARRLSWADEVTTSPVLGLRIKAGTAGPSGAAPSRGAFVCQLCGEPYADPPSLAQHRCSRIVRVEYRCPDCQKSFSCPANLASHRRWHKPRPGSAEPLQRRPVQPLQLQHRPPPDSAPLFPCPHCRRGFRRQAYLRKHLGTHRPPTPPPQPPPAPQPPPLWHLLPPDGAPDKRCPAALQRHPGKCLPAVDGRQLLLLQLPLRPGC